MGAAPGCTFARQQVQPAPTQRCNPRGVEQAAAFRSPGIGPASRWKPEFWDALVALAASRGDTLAALVAKIDADRTPERPLASALRVFALTAPR